MPTSLLTTKSNTETQGHESAKIGFLPADPATTLSAVTTPALFKLQKTVRPLTIRLFTGLTFHQHLLTIGQASLAQ